MRGSFGADRVASATIHWRRHATAALLGLGLAAFTAALFPSSSSSSVPLLDVGAVAPDNVISPFAIDVPKRAAEVARERSDLARTAPPVLRFVPGAADTTRAMLQRFEQAILRADASGATEQDRAQAVLSSALFLGVRLSLVDAVYLASPARAEAVLASLSRLLDRWLATGVATNADIQDVTGQVTVIRDSVERPVDVDDVATFSTVVARARRLAADLESPAGEAVALRLLATFFHPTLVLDRTATELRRQERQRAVSPSRFSLRAGEKIVGAHEVVGRDEHDKLVALRTALAGREGNRDAVTRMAGGFAVDLLLVSALGIVLLLYRPALYASARTLVFVALTFAAVITAAAVVARTAAASHPELIPVAMAAILFSVLFDPRISTVAAMLLAVLVGIQNPFGNTTAVFVGVVAGVAAAFSVRVVRRRNQALYSATVIAIAYLLAAIAVGLLLGRGWEDMLHRAGWGTLNAVLSVALAMIVLPAAEELTGIDTYLRLLEWSDLNRPLMQQLSLEAPGTFAHTMLIANLTEGACTAIGANGLLGRVGAYYHDIGKLNKAQYFVENQSRGRNPHDKLNPGASAGIIRNHVTEGVALADANRLPKAVKAFITEHHGTVPIAFFLEKAKERGGVRPDVADYTYPGPTPRSVETAVCMLADGVEAATRAIPDPTPERIREVVERIVRQRLDQGQLRDAPITIKQLETVKEQFTRILTAMYHNRIDYPVAAGGVAPELTPV